MISTGIIVEYNPFHNGHKYHLEKSRDLSNADVVIAVMSGNFVQRGQPAIVDKWKRVEWALKNGVDMLVELPVIYSCQAAEIFALGAVSILDKLNVDNLVFGSESGDIKGLENTAKLLIDDKEKIDIEVRKYTKEGISYPDAFAKAIASYGINDIFTPNNILAIEYLKAKHSIKSKINALTIKRKAVGYNDIEIKGDIASATSIRKALFWENSNKIKYTLPKKVYEELIDENKIQFKDYYDILRYRIISRKDSLAEIQDMEKGFENRLYKSAVKNNNFDEFYNEVLTKRITMSRLNRVLLHSLLEITEQDTKFAKQNPFNYIRILGFNDTGRLYLNKIKKELEGKLITKLNYQDKNIDDNIKYLLKIEERANNIYNIIYGGRERKIPIYHKSK